MDHITETWVSGISFRRKNSETLDFKLEFTPTDLAGGKLILDRQPNRTEMDYITYTAKRIHNEQKK